MKKGSVSVFKTIQTAIRRGSAIFCLTACFAWCFGNSTAFAAEEVSISTILAAKYYTNAEGFQRVGFYLLCDTYDNLYISGDLKTKRFICNFPNVMKYKFGIRQNGDIIAVFRSEFSKAETSYGPGLDNVRKNPRVLLRSEQYRRIHEVDFGEYDEETGEGLKPCGWLENCGFCSLPSGDVLFAEYTRMGVLYTANCWRIKEGSDLTDPASWEIVKQFQVAENDKITTYDESVIEHFHTVQRDPYTGIVYIATGDLRSKSQMWYSRDNGDTWEQQTFTDPSTGETLTSGEKYFRILNYNFTDNYVYWSSDSSKKHAILRCERAETGELDPDSITVLAELERLEGSPATYGTVYDPANNFMVLMERCDENADTMRFRVYDLDDDTIKTIDTINVAGSDSGHIGFRTEYTEFAPRDGVIKVGFGSNAEYRNNNDLCGNPGDSDWRNNINNMWIKVDRDPDGEIVVEYGYYQI